MLHDVSGTHVMSIHNRALVSLVLTVAPVGWSTSKARSTGFDAVDALPK